MTTERLIAIIAPILFLAAYLAFVGSIFYILSILGGWQRVASIYQAKEPPKGRCYRMQSAAVGWVNYGSCLTIHASDEGLHIKVWPLFQFANPPLFLPWSALKNRQEKRILWSKFTHCEIGDPAIGKMLLPAKVFETEPQV